MIGFGAVVRARDPAAATDWPQTFSHRHIGVGGQVIAEGGLG